MPEALSFTEQASAPYAIIGFTNVVYIQFSLLIFGIPLLISSLYLPRYSDRFYYYIAYSYTFHVYFIPVSYPASKRNFFVSVRLFWIMPHSVDLSCLLILLLYPLHAIFWSERWQVMNY